MSEPGTSDQTTVTLGHHWSFNILNDPKRLAFVLSRYQFAARMAGPGKRILELGSSEGLGGLVLAETAQSYTGIDLDEEAVNAARRNLAGPQFSFHTGNFLGVHLGTFDCVVSIDVVEHIDPPREHEFFETCYHNLTEDGICIIGTPNITASAYASPASQAGHVNLFDGKRLRSTLLRYFHHVFLFGLNDEVVHTGYISMAHFLLAVGVGKRKTILLNDSVSSEEKENPSSISPSPGDITQGEGPERWLAVKKQMGEKLLELGPQLASWYHHHPRQLLYSLTCYKFASKLIGPPASSGPEVQKTPRILDIGCGEGIGTYLLAVENGSAQGIDLDTKAIAAAERNFGHDPRVQYVLGPVASLSSREWEAVVCLNTTSFYVWPDLAGWDILKSCLTRQGLVILGLSRKSLKFDPPHLDQEMQRHFHHVFWFSVNEEVIQAGVLPQADFLIAVGSRKKT